MAYRVSGGIKESE
ncbi:Protein of unknown function [Bacillus wiedmannii]|nr:Protein of unknown function [Bacillus wiedmannii]